MNIHAATKLCWNVLTCVVLWTIFQVIVKRDALFKYFGTNINLTLCEGIKLQFMSE